MLAASGNQYLGVDSTAGGVGAALLRHDQHLRVAGDRPVLVGDRLECLVVDVVHGQHVRDDAGVVVDIRADGDVVVHVVSAVAIGRQDVVPLGACQALHEQPDGRGDIVRVIGPAATPRDDIHEWMVLYAVAVAYDGRAAVLTGLVPGAVGTTGVGRGVTCACCPCYSDGSEAPGAERQHQHQDEQDDPPRAPHRTP